MSLWEERAARNEALFREVNEQVRGLADRFAADTDPIEFVCECSNDACVNHIRMPASVYEQVRANPQRFFLVPGHESSVERVVERGDGYLIVEKVGIAGRIASETDPRS